MAGSGLREVGGGRTVQEQTSLQRLLLLVLVTL